MKTSIFIIMLFFLNAVNAQEKSRDTLFFKLDNKYVYESNHESKSFLLKDSNDVNHGTFYFENIKKLNNIKSNKVLCLEKFVHQTKFYNKGRQRLDDYGLWEYFNNYVIILIKNVDGKKEYTQVESGFEIE